MCDGAREGSIGLNSCEAGLRAVPPICRFAGEGLLIILPPKARKHLINRDQLCASLRYHWICSRMYHPPYYSEVPIISIPDRSMFPFILV